MPLHGACNGNLLPHVPDQDDSRTSYLLGPCLAPGTWEVKSGSCVPMSPGEAERAWDKRPTCCSRP